MSKEVIKEIEIKNGDLKIMVNILAELKLDIETSSARRRFIRLFKNELTDIEMEADEIRELYAEKDEKGAMVIIDNVIKMNKENKKKATEAFEKMNDRTVKVEYTKNVEDKKICAKLIVDEIAKEKKRMLDAGGLSDQDYFNIETLERIVSCLK